MFVIAKTRHDVFHSGFDMAIFSQAIWNTVHGNFLYSSIKGGICLLGDHVSPILALLAPLYAIWPNPSSLLLAQSIALGACLFPIAYLAKHEELDSKLIIALIISYALYLPTRSAGRFDFHPELLADPLLIFAFLFLKQKKLLFSSLCLCIALTAKETLCAPIAMFSLYACFFERQWRFGLMWIIFSVGYFFFAINWILPRYSLDPYFYLRGNYAAGGSGFNLYHLILQALSFKNLIYLIKLFLPLGLLPFFAPAQLLLTLPILAQNLLARNENTTSIFFHYTASLTPYIFISYIYGLKSITKWVSNKSVQIFIIMAPAILMMGVSDYYIYQTYSRKANLHTQEIHSTIKNIPSIFSVRTHEFFAPHLSNRKKLYIYENNHPKEGGSIDAMNADLIILDKVWLGENALDKFNLILKSNYTLAFEKNGLLIFQNNSSSPSITSLNLWNQ